MSQVELQHTPSKGSREAYKFLILGAIKKKEVESGRVTRNMTLQD